MSNAQALEDFRVSLENGKSNPMIAAALGEFNYDENGLQEGMQLWQKAADALKHNDQEADETAEAYHEFKRLYGEVDVAYRKTHRKRAKVVFKKDSITMQKLGIDGRLSRTYIRWFESVKKFYDTAIASPEIQAELGRMKITLDDLNAMQEKVKQLQSARSAYLNEVGEDQAATEAKDKAMGEIEDWMSEFYDVAEIALEDEPQLMESLGKVVR